MQKCFKKNYNTNLKYWSHQFFQTSLGFSGGTIGKESPYNARDMDLIPRSGRSPGVGNGNPLQDSCLENSMAWKFPKAWKAAFHGVAKSRTWLSNCAQAVSTGNSACCPVEPEMAVTPRKRVYIYTWLAHLTVQQKITWNCKAIHHNEVFKRMEILIFSL